MRSFFAAASVAPTIWMRDAGHFLQEDAGEEIARAIAEWVHRG